MLEMDFRMPVQMLCLAVFTIKKPVMAKKQKTKQTSSAVHATLNPEVQEALIHFFTCHPPKEFSRGLRNMVVELMSYHEDGQRDYVCKMMLGLEMLFALLDQVEDHGW